LKSLIFKRFLIIISLFSAFFFTACDTPQTTILFNDCPITKENILQNSTQFKVGKKFYYIFITQRQIETKFIRVKILKRDEKANYETTKMIYCNDFKLSKDEVFYYTDYIVMNDAGYYYMLIYAMNRLDKPLASADFQVK
jgi:hypothetical protein